MLPSLAIQNFKLFRELEVPSLGQINLIAGKNNTGKTALLEAISIYAAKGDFSWITRLLDERGESLTDRKDNKNASHLNLETFSSLFTNRSEELTIYIGKNKACFNTSAEDAIGIGFKDKGKVTSSIIEEGDIGETALFRALQIFGRKQKEQVIPLSDAGNPDMLASKNADMLQFVRANSINKSSNSQLWSEITLTDKEHVVIEALRIVDRDVEQMNFREKRISSDKLEPVVRKKNSSSILPLQSMGDGMNRILSIILSLVSCKNGYFLIDEFENGLHYSVQKQLWEIIFKIAKEQNTQVFATTHSSDCMRSFAKVAEQENTLEAKCIRIENKAGVFKAVELTPEDILYAVNRDIEIR